MPTIPRPVRSAACILIVSALLLLAFALCAAGVALLLGLLRGSDPLTPENLCGGIICSLIAWLFVAVFHVKRERFRWPVAEPTRFFSSVKAILEELGYDLVRQTPNDAAFRPKFQAFLFGGTIQITLDEGAATVTGPKYWIEVLRKRLRFQGHVEKARQPLLKAGSNGERFLKRVQLRIRLSPEQWPAFGQQVLEPLAREGQVVCDLSVLVQSDAGVREKLLDGPVRHWLDQQGLEAEVHKDFVQIDLVSNAAAWQPVGGDVAAD